jgi:hypothetical protein
MKYLFLILVFCSCGNNKQNMVTAKHATDTLYYINAYKSSDLYITKKMFLELRLANINNNQFNRLEVKYPKYYIVLDGDYINRIEVDSYTYNMIKEGQIYNP